MNIQPARAENVGPFNILHLSDLHFGKNHGFRQGNAGHDDPTLGDTIYKALQGRLANGLNIDLLIFSGDLLSQDQPRDAELAKGGIRELTDKLGLNSGQVLCVPGNHDLYFDVDIDRYQFYDGVMRDLGFESCLCGNLPLVHELAERKVNGYSLAVVLLNSCAQVTDIGLSGIGDHGFEQMNRMEERLHELEITPRSHIILAVLHHHLLPIAPVVRLPEPRDGQHRNTSITLDANEVLRQLNQLGFSVVLHGHQHKSAILEYRNRLYDDHPIYIFAGGSCGTKPAARGGNPLQFFLYEIYAESMYAHSFQQLEANPSLFNSEPKTILLPFNRSSSGSFEACEEDLRIQNWRDSLVVSRDIKEADNSDLFYLLLSVKSCPESRRIIRDVVAGLSESKEWHDARPAYFKLEAMYDVLGKWDLVVVFRLDMNVNVKLVTKLIHKELLTHSQMQSAVRRPQNREQRLFDILDTVDVQSESNSVESMLNPPPKTVVERIRLGSTEEYDSSRCQKGFVYITKPPVKGETEPLLSGLQEALKAGEVEKIIESVCVGDNEVVIETMMTCFQSAELNKLNRAIEDTVALHGCQKYTLLCYGYDEEEFCIAQQQ